MQRCFTFKASWYRSTLKLDALLQPDTWAFWWQAVAPEDLPTSQQNWCIMYFFYVNSRSDELYCFTASGKERFLMSLLSFFKNQFYIENHYWLHVFMFLCLLSFHRHPATAKWYDRRDSVFIEFCVADSKDVKVNFDKTKCGFRYVCLMAFETV